MKTKITTLIICIATFMSCGDSASSNEQNQDEVQTKVTEQVEQSQEQNNEQNDEQSDEQVSESLAEIDYETAKNYLYEGYHSIPNSEGQFISGDFDKDGKQNFAIIVFKGKTASFEGSEPVTLQIFEEQKDNTYDLVTESGVLTDLMLGGRSEIILNKNVISVKSGQMRYDNEWKFRYDKKHDDYVLIGSEYNSYGNAANDGSGNRSTNYLTGKRISKFNEFDYEKEELIEGKPVTTKVPSVKVKPIFLKDFNQESSYDL